MSKKRNRAIVLTSLSGVAQRVIQLLSSLITLPLALHALGLAGFGVWGATTSLMSLNKIITMGFGSALITLLPYAFTAGRGEQARAYIAASLLGAAGLAALFLAGMALLFATGTARPPAPPFLVASIALVLNIPLSLGTDIWFALQKGYMAALWNAAQTLLGLAGLVVGVLAGANVTALVAIFYVAMLAASGGCLTHVMLANQAIRPNRRPGGGDFRLILVQGGLLSAVSTLSSCAFVFDNVMALTWLGPGASALMTVAMRVCMTATGLLDSVTQSFWPSFADALAAKDHRWVGRAIRHGSAIVLGLSLSGAGLLVLLGRPVLVWWLHQDVGINHTLLCVMAFWIVIMTLTSIPASLLRASATLKPQIIVFGIAALAGIGLKYVAARYFGVPGILMVSPLLWISFVIPSFFLMIRQVFRNGLVVDHKTIGLSAR